MIIYFITPIISTQIQESEITTLDHEPTKCRNSINKSNQEFSHLVDSCNDLTSYPVAPRGYRGDLGRGEKGQKYSRNRNPPR